MYKTMIERLFLYTGISFAQFFTPLLQADEYTEIGQPVTNVYTPKEHGLHDYNWSSTQADNGFIYVGNSVGISEWDGETWQHYPTPQNTPVRQIIQWRDKRLYIGTTNDIGYYQTDQNGVLGYHSLLENWPEEQRQFGQVWAMAANERGLIFITTDAIHFWNGEFFQSIHNVTPGRARVFSVDDIFVFKAEGESAISEVHFDASNSPVPGETHFWLEKSNLVVPAKAILSQVFYNQKNNLVVATSTYGIFEQIDNELIQRQPAISFGLRSNIYHVLQASDGYYYLSSYQHGLFILDKDMQLVRQYREKDSISMDSVFATMEDRQGNIWVTGVPNVVKMVPPHRYSQFQVGNISTSITRLTKGNCLSGDCIVAVGTGLFQLNQSSEKNASPRFERLTPIKRINVDYIEYQNHQFYSGVGGIFYRKTSEDSEPFIKLIDVHLGRNLRIDPVSGTLFAASVDGLFHISYLDNKMSYQKIGDLTDEFHTIEIDKSGLVWAGTAVQSLYQIENAQFADRETKIRKFDKNDGLATGKIIPFKLSSSAPGVIDGESDSEVVFATKNGLMAYQQNRQPALQTISTLPDIFHTNDKPVNYLHDEQMVASAGRRIWYQIGNSTGYTQQDANQQWQQYEDLFKAFDDSKLIDLFVTQNNILWFALITGEVYRVNIALTENIPPKGTLNIRSINNLQNQQVINGGLQLSSFPDLDPDSNSIRINFALADNSSLIDTQYRHRLLGSGNRQWSGWSTEHHSDFTQLAGANYHFQVEAQDAWGRITNTEFVFSVLPPWYLGPAAWILYSVIAVGLLILSGWLTQRWRTRQLTELNVALEQTVAERTREVSAKVDELKEQQKLKDRFFSNVSHEFRTPLTLIIGPLETILDEYTSNMEGKAKSLTATALNNANKMLALVGQVLDLNRLEVGKLPLRISEYDIAELLRNIQSRFESWAEQENQTITCENCADPVMLYFDQDQMDKCVANLVSNAIKYSGKHSKLTIKLINEQDSVTIQVIDNGRGISAEAKDKVFERFYQDKASEQNTTPGTGIGLSLVKELIELHQGKVSLTSQLGEGCCFSLTLKKGNQHFAREQLVEPLILADATGGKDQRALLAEKIETNEIQQQDQTTLLIVDDNVELRQFLSLRLSATYRILQAQDGEEGFKIACEELPDLIVSDVMMPKLTGYELTQKLKSSPATHSIPVILLTAKASKRETVEGFASGADDYLTKPFDTSELIMRVNAQISTRKTIRESIQFEQSVTITGITQRSSFVETIHHHLLKHLSDPEFSVEALAKLLFVSRATLSRKCKEELGMSPGAYITETRLQHARNLLQANTLSVSEIAYAVGFESLAYFSRSFKKHTGTPPSEYISH